MMIDATYQKSHRRLEPAGSKPDAADRARQGRYVYCAARRDRREQTPDRLLMAVDWFREALQTKVTTPCILGRKSRTEPLRYDERR